MDQRINSFVKISEMRPSPCGSRIGDIVESKDVGSRGKRFLQVKCRQCTRNEGRDVYHYVQTGQEMQR